MHKNRQAYTMIKMSKGKHQYGSQLKTHKVTFLYSCGTIKILCIHLLIFNPLKPELNPICYLLALLGAHNFLHVSRIRVKLLTFRLLMS